LSTFWVRRRHWDQPYLTVCIVERRSADDLRRLLALLRGYISDALLCSGLVVHYQHHRALLLITRPRPVRLCHGGPRPVCCPWCTRWLSWMLSNPSPRFPGHMGLPSVTCPIYSRLLNRKETSSVLSIRVGMSCALIRRLPLTSRLLWVVPRDIDAGRAVVGELERETSQFEEQAVAGLRCQRQRFPCNSRLKGGTLLLRRTC
jgi:hypothetical protein